MCEVCKNVKTVKFFSTPQEYLDCLKYIQDLVNDGDFKFKSKDCDTDKVKDENGCWIADVITHVIECKNRGQQFTCVVVTHRGGGSFERKSSRIV